MTLLSKAVLVFTLFLLSINAYAFKVKADELFLLIYITEDEKFNYAIKNKVIAGLPEWDGEGTAPLSVEAATELAINKHKEKYVKAKLRSISLKSKRTHCGKSVSCPESLWYYKAKVKGGKKRTYIILLDGSFVSPKKG